MSYREANQKYCQKKEFKMFGFLIIDFVICKYLHSPPQVTNFIKDERMVFECLVPLVEEEEMKENAKKLQLLMRTYTITHMLVAASNELLSNFQLRAKVQKYFIFMLKVIQKSQRFITSVTIEYPLNQGKMMSEVENCKWKFIQVGKFQNGRLTLHDIKHFFSVQYCQYLCWLYLDGNLISWEGVRELTVREYPYLYYIDLSYNPLGNRGVKQLCRAQWPKLAEIRIERVGATAHVLSYLKKIPQDQKTLLLTTEHLSIATMQMLPQLDYESAIVFREKEKGIEDILNQNVSEEDSSDDQVLWELINVNTMSKKVDLEYNTNNYIQEEGKPAARYDFSLWQSQQGEYQGENKAGELASTLILDYLSHLYEKHCEDIDDLN